MTIFLCKSCGQRSYGNSVLPVSCLWCGSHYLVELKTSKSGFVKKDYFIDFSKRFYNE